MTGPPPALRRQILTLAARTPSLTRRQRSGQRWLLAAAVVLSALVLVGATGVSLGGRTLEAVLFTQLGMLLVVAVMAAIALGGGMLGRPRGLLLLATGATPVALALCKLPAVVVSLDVAAAPLVSQEKFDLGGSLDCLVLGLFLGAPILLALALDRRRCDPIHPGSTGAALGAVAGAISAAFVDLACPAARLAHLLGGHIASVAIFALIGAMLGARCLSLGGQHEPRPNFVKES